MRKTISPLDILKNKSPRNPVRMQERMEAAIASQQIKNVEADTVNELAPSLGDTYLTETGSRADGIIFAENINQIQQGDNTSHLRTITIPFDGSFLSHDNIVELVLTGNVWNNSGSTQTIEATLNLEDSTGAITHMINSATGASVTNSTTQKGFMLTVTFMQSPKGGKWVMCNERWEIEGQNTTIRSTETELTSATDVSDIDLIEFTAYLTGTTLIHFTMDTLVVWCYEGLTTGAVKSFWSMTGDDTVIASNAATTNYGTDVTFAVGESSSGVSWIRRALIKPDGLTNIPTGATITKAILFLTIASDQATSGATYRIFQLLKNWTETGATYNKFDGVTDWAAAGMLTTQDYDSTILGSFAVGAAETVGTAKIFDFNTTGLSILNGYLDGTYSYYGFCIISDTELNDAYGFHSYETATPDYRPVFYIEYQI